MAEEPETIPMLRLARWLAVGVLICIAIAFYFRDGTRLPPITATGAAATAAEPDR